MTGGFLTNVHRRSSRSSRSSTRSALISSSTRGVRGNCCRFRLLSEITRKLGVTERPQNRRFTLRRRLSRLVLVEDAGVELPCQPFLPSVGDLICTISEVSDESVVCENPTAGPDVGFRPGEFTVTFDTRRRRWPVLSKETEDVGVGVFHPAAGYPHTPTLRSGKHIRYANTLWGVSDSIVFGVVRPMKSDDSYKAYRLADCGQVTHGPSGPRLKRRDGDDAPARDWRKANMRLTLPEQERSERLRNRSTGNDPLPAFCPGIFEVDDGGF